MIKGPWPLSADETEHVIPLPKPYITPMFNGERVALRISVEDTEDYAKRSRGPGVKGIITDLDTGKRYTLIGRSCGESCYCDAEIVEVMPDEEKDVLSVQEIVGRLKTLRQAIGGMPTHSWPNYHDKWRAAIDAACDRLSSCPDLAKELR
jgi:hypothetical protein